MRIGHGYDVHAFGEGNSLILGGVRIPFNHSFIAHSDGDVLTHALIDSVLGALGRGDIGTHFPDTDIKYLNCSSLDLLSEVFLLMECDGYAVGNIDITIVAQGPKMATFVSEMSCNLATVLRCKASNINIKATTTEWLGFTGRKEGVACYSSVLLEQIEH
jgi:2-C-methyl-D-erythritol 2,4-cyclodiphosphate synthase